MQYRYEAVTQSGKKVRGMLDADSDTHAVEQLRGQRLVPVALKNQSVFMGQIRQPGQSIWQVDIAPKNPHKAKFPVKKLIAAYQQIAIMLRAGVSLSMVLEVVTESEQKPAFKKVLSELQADLFSGVSLSQSMQKFACFDRVTVNLVAAGEADGHLERSFEQIVRVHEKQLAIVNKLKSASIYPAMLLVMVIAVLAFLNISVLPTFLSMYDSLGTEVPPLTRFVMASSTFLSHWWWVLALAALALGFGYHALRRENAAFALRIDQMILRIPLVGRMLKNGQIARFSRILSTMLSSGQDFLSAVELGRSVLSNRYLNEGFAAAAEEIRVGVPVSVAMGRLAFLEPIFISMLRAGEESGALSETLAKMADLYEAETDESAKRLTTAMEPLMTVLIAGIVGVVVIAIMLPMLNMMNLVGGI